MPPSCTPTFFVPVAVKKLEPINADDQIGDRLSAIAGDPRESSFLFQRLSVVVQHFNMIAFRGSFISEMDIEV